MASPTTWRRTCEQSYAASYQMVFRSQQNRLHDFYKATQHHDQSSYINFGSLHPAGVRWNPERPQPIEAGRRHQIPQAAITQKQEQMTPNKRPTSLDCLAAVALTCPLDDPVEWPPKVTAHVVPTAITIRFLRLISSYSEFFSRASCFSPLTHSLCLSHSACQVQSPYRIRQSQRDEQTEPVAQRPRSNSPPSPHLLPRATLKAETDKAAPSPPSSHSLRLNPTKKKTMESVNHNGKCRPPIDQPQKKEPVLTAHTARPSQSRKRRLLDRHIDTHLEPQPKQPDRALRGSARLGSDNTSARTKGTWCAEEELRSVVTSTFQRSSAVANVSEVSQGPTEYQCNYCSRIKKSLSAGTDGRVRIRCDCGGKHQDNTPRMHAM